MNLLIVGVIIAMNPECCYMLLLNVHMFTAAYVMTIQQWRNLYLILLVVIDLIVGYNLVI